MKVILVGLVLGLMAATACDVESDELATDPKAPINAAGVESWDLRTPPTRADVGMKDGEDFVAYEDHANPRPIEVLLPQGHRLKLDNITMVTFDRVAAPSRLQASRGPVQMDFRAGPLPLDDAQNVVADSLRAIGADPVLAVEWRRRVDSRPPLGPTTDQRIEGGGSAEIGYLNVGVGAVFNPVNESDTAIVKWHVNLVK